MRSPARANAGGRASERPGAQETRSEAKTVPKRELVKSSQVKSSQVFVTVHAWADRTAETRGRAIRFPPRRQSACNSTEAVEEVTGSRGQRWRSSIARHRPLSTTAPHVSAHINYCGRSTAVSSIPCATRRSLATFLIPPHTCASLVHVLLLQHRRLPSRRHGPAATSSVAAR